MIKIYKYDPSSIWFKDVVNDSTLKGKKRDIAIENAIKEHGTQISIVEYFKDRKRNSWGKGYCYDCYGEVENSIERLVNAEINYDEGLTYLDAKNNHPEDLIESRTSWDEMKDYADGLYRFVDSLISDIVTDKISVSQNTWKPSKEQVEALSTMAMYCDIATSFDAYKQKVVESLCQDLKKLGENKLS